MESIENHFEVTGPLHESIRYFYCIRTSSEFKTTNQHLSPNLEMMLIFNFGSPVRISFADDAYGELRLNRVGVVGPLRKMLNYEVLPGSDLIVAVFNTNGFYRLFELPMDEIGGETVMDPDDLAKTDGFSELWKILKNISSLNDRIDFLKDYARLFIHEVQEAAAPLIKGISYLHNPLIQPVRAMADDADVSERTIQLRFKKYLGYSPKEFIRFLRFKQVINAIQIQEATDVDWFGLIEKFGYHDQSHLIKDFHHYLGTTPQKFVREVAGKEFCVSRPS